MSTDQLPKVILTNVPQCLRQRRHWVCWRNLDRDGKPTKVPFDPKTGSAADTTRAETWGIFDEALAAWARDSSYEGIGYVFAADDPFCGVDLDDCIDEASKELKPWARELVATLNSYTEISPSGRGVKVFLQASKPGDRCRKRYQDGEIEIYDQNRFFTVTGRRLDEISVQIERRQSELEALYVQVFGETMPEPVPPVQRAQAGAPPPITIALTDDQVLAKARRSRKSAKFSALWEGQWEGDFKSQSEADSSLVFLLAFYTKDAAQIDRMFRRSGLIRPKWDEKHGAKTYGEMTIERALSQVTAQWQPQNRRSKLPAGPPSPPRPPVNPNLPSIVISDMQLNDLSGRAIEALEGANQPPVLFVRGGQLCRVVPDENGIPRVDPLDKVRVRGRLTQAANFFTASPGPNEPVLTGVNPPVALAEHLATLGAWPFPPLLGIAHAPIVRADGSLHLTPGYDPQSRLLYCPAPGLTIPAIPDRPTKGQARDAMGQLLPLIADFPFANPASRANALAVLFSLLLRPAIHGHIPMAVAVAPVQGTGKTLLMTLLGDIALGRVAGESIPSKHNDDEWRKKITSILLAGSPYVLLDNIPDNSTIDSPALAAALTGYEWSDRILGKSETIRLPSRIIWVATGNNLRIAGDMPRRCYTITLDANAERPWERKGFKIPDIEQYVRENRGRLLAAALTVIRGWYVAGCPMVECPTIGSFQEWADKIGSLLAFAGIEGFLANLDETRVVQDEDTQQWSAFLSAWWDEFGDEELTVDVLLQRLLGRVGDDAVPLPEPLLVNQDKGAGALKRSLGRNLSRLSGRVFDGRKLHSPREEPHKKVRLWQLSPLCNPANSADSDPNPAANPATGDEQ